MAEALRCRPGHHRKSESLCLTNMTSCYSRSLIRSFVSPTVGTLAVTAVKYVPSVSPQVLSEEYTLNDILHDVTREDLKSLRLR